MATTTNRFDSLPVVSSEESNLEALVDQNVQVVEDNPRDTILLGNVAERTNNTNFSNAHLNSIVKRCPKCYSRNHWENLVWDLATGISSIEGPFNYVGLYGRQGDQEKIANYLCPPNTKFKLFLNTKETNLKYNSLREIMKDRKYNVTVFQDETVTNSRWTNYVLEYIKEPVFYNLDFCGLGEPKALLKNNKKSQQMMLKSGDVIRLGSIFSTNGYRKYKDKGGMIELLRSYLSLFEAKGFSFEPVCETEVNARWAKVPHIYMAYHTFRVHHNSR